jgi:hypothetical protein
MSQIFFQDELEKKQHEEAIKNLCDQFPDQQDLIRENYLQSLEPLLEDASIRTYLPIFVSRKIKAELERPH